METMRGNKYGAKDFQNKEGCFPFLAFLEKLPIHMGMRRDNGEINNDKVPSRKIGTTMEIEANTTRKNAYTPLFFWRKERQ